MQTTLENYLGSLSNENEACLRTQTTLHQLVP